MGKEARRKGHQFEREIARSLRELDPSARRHMEYQEGGLDIHTRLPYAIQCKCQKTPNVWKALKEAREASEGKTPLAVVRRTGVVTVAVLEWKDFIELLRKVGR